MISPATLHTENASSVFGEAKEGPDHPCHQEFAALIDDQPGTLGRICHALTDRNVNILAAR